MKGFRDGRDGDAEGGDHERRVCVGCRDVFTRGAGPAGAPAPLVYLLTDRANAGSLRRFPVNPLLATFLPPLWEPSHDSPSLSQLVASAARYFPPRRSERESWTAVAAPDVAPPEAPVGAEEICSPSQPRSSPLSPSELPSQAFLETGQFVLVARQPNFHVPSCSGSDGSSVNSAAAAPSDLHHPAKLAFMLACTPVQAAGGAGGLTAERRVYFQSGFFCDFYI